MAMTNSISRRRRQPSLDSGRETSFLRIKVSGPPGRTYPLQFPAPPLAGGRPTRLQATPGTPGHQALCTLDTCFHSPRVPPPSLSLRWRSDSGKSPTPCCFIRRSTAGDYTISLARSQKPGSDHRTPARENWRGTGEICTGRNSFPSENRRHIECRPTGVRILTFGFLESHDIRKLPLRDSRSHRGNHLEAYEIASTI